MNNKNILNESLKIAEELSGKMDDLMNMQSRLFAQLPAEEREKLKFVENDISQLKRAFKKGDEDKLNEFLKKYAGNNNR